MSATEIRVLRGDRRRQVRDYLAFKRAEFELNYQGKPIVPFDRRAVIQSVRVYDESLLYAVTDNFVREVQRRVPYCKQALQEHARMQA